MRLILRFLLIVAAWYGSPSAEAAQVPKIFASLRRRAPAKRPISQNRDGVLKTIAEPGPKIGEGKAKVAYEVPGHPGLALLVTKKASWRRSLLFPRRTVLRKEAALLDRIAAHGVPTARFREIGTYRGAPAALMDKHAVGSKPLPTDGLKLMDRLNEKSLADLADIRHRLVGRTYVADLHFLVKEDGSLIVSDPLFASKRRGLRAKLTDLWHPHLNMDRNLAEMERKIRLALDVRGGKVARPTTGEEYLEQAATYRGAP